MPLSRSRTRPRRIRRAPPASSSRGWQQRKARITHTNRRLQTGSRSVRHYVKRRARTRPGIFGILTLGIAATAFTLIAIGSISQLAAWELGLAAEGVAFGTAWLLGDRANGQPSPAKQVIAKARASLCGAPTLDGTPCKKRGRCPHHQGGAGGGNKGTGGASTHTGRKPTVRAKPKAKTAPVHSTSSGPVPLLGKPHGSRRKTP